MLLAVKGNRECKISLEEREEFSEKGFDIYEKSGDGKVNLVEKYSKDSKVVKELRARVKELEAQVPAEEPKKPSTAGKGK